MELVYFFHIISLFISLRFYLTGRDSSQNPRLYSVTIVFEKDKNVLFWFSKLFKTLIQQLCWKLFHLPSPVDKSLSPRSPFFPIACPCKPELWFG